LKLFLFFFFLQIIDLIIRNKIIFSFLYMIKRTDKCFFLDVWEIISSSVRVSIKRIDRIIVGELNYRISTRRAVRNLFFSLRQLSKLYPSPGI
jgi:hypothetical protein